MSVSVHPTAIIQPGAELAEGVEVGPYSIVGANVRVGPRTRLISHVVLDGVTTIGEDCTIYPFALLGGPPQHSGYRNEPTQLVIGDRNTIREHATMHTGTSSGRGVTRIGSDGLFMATCHIAHDCIVGNNVTLANTVGLAGHVKVDDFVFMGGHSAAHQYTRIGRYSFIGGLAPLTKDVIPYGLVGNDARLEGLNLVGLKRRGFSREAVTTLRTAYRALFADEGAFSERLEDVASTYADSPEVMEIVDFIRAPSNRPLCMP